MNEVQSFYKQALESGKDRKKISDYLASKGVSQAEIDKAEISYLDEKSGLVGKVRKGALAIPRALFPQVTNFLESQAFQVGAGTRDYLTGDQEAIQRRKTEMAPGKILPKVAGASGEIGMDIILGKLLDLAGNKFLSPAMKKLPIGTPSTVEKAARSSASEIWQTQIAPLLEEGRKTKNIPTSKFLPILDDLLQQAVDSGNKDMFDDLAKISERITQFGEKMTPTNAYRLASDLGLEVRMPSGDLKPLSGEVGRLAKTKVGPELRKAAYEGLGESGEVLKDATGQYGEFADVARKMSPKNAFSGYGPAIASGMISGGAAAINPTLGAIGAPITAGIAVKSIPYFNYLAKQLLGRGTDLAKTPTLGVANQLLQMLIGPK